MCVCARVCAFGAARCGVVRCGVALRGVAWCGVVRCGVGWGGGGGRGWCGVVVSPAIQHIECSDTSPDMLRSQRGVRGVARNRGGPLNLRLVQPPERGCAALRARSRKSAARGAFGASRGHADTTERCNAARRTSGTRRRGFAGLHRNFEKLPHQHAGTRKECCNAARPTSGMRPRRAPPMCKEDRENDKKTAAPPTCTNNDTLSYVAVLSPRPPRADVFSLSPRSMARIATPCTIRPSEPRRITHAAPVGQQHAGTRPLTSRPCKTTVYMTSGLATTES